MNEYDPQLVGFYKDGFWEKEGIELVELDTMKTPADGGSKRADTVYVTPL